MTVFFQTRYKSLIRLVPETDLEWLRVTQVFNPSQYESIWARIGLNRILYPRSKWFRLKIRFSQIQAPIDFDWLEWKTWFGFIWIDASDWIGIYINLCLNRFPDESFVLGFNPSHSKPFQTNLINASYLGWWRSFKNQSGLIRFNPNQVFNPSQSKSIGAWISPNRIFNPNHFDLGFIRIENSD